MGCIVGRYPTSVSIVPSGQGIVGRTDFDLDVPTCARRYLDTSDEKRRYVRTRVLTECAATIAHDIKCPGRLHDRGDEEDDRQVRAIIEETVSWTDHNTYLEDSKEEAERLLKENWEWVEIVALKLLCRGTLSGADVLGLRPESCSCELL